MVADLGTAEAVEEVTEIDTEERGGGRCRGEVLSPNPTLHQEVWRHKCIQKGRQKDVGRADMEEKWWGWGEGWSGVD